MSVTVRQVTEQALALSGHLQQNVTHTVQAQTIVNLALEKLNHVDSNGQISSTREAKYMIMAIPLINKYCRDILNRENPLATPQDISTLTQTLAISDDSALRILPDAIAMEFATADRLTDLANFLSSQYFNYDLPSIRIQLNDDNNKYIVPAPAICTTLQVELLPYEGKEDIPDPLSDLDDVLTISDRTALGVMPYGLAARWALTDGNSALYNDMSVDYINMKKAILPISTRIEDVYGTMKDYNIQF